MAAPRLDRPIRLYRLWSEAEELLYIGLTIDVSRRMRDHAHTKAWWPEVARVSAEQVSTNWLAAYAAEEYAILEEQPRYNVADKKIRAARVHAATSGSPFASAADRTRAKAMMAIAREQARL